MRADGCDMLVEAALGPIIYRVTRKELIDQGYLTPAKVVYLEPVFEKSYPLTYADAYTKHIVNNESRNALIVATARQFIVGGRKTLVLVQHIAHGESLNTTLLDAGVRSKFIHGKSKDRSVDFSALDVVIASQVFNEGVDFPKADALIIAGAGASSIRVTQQAGRVLRLSEGKTDAIIVDFIDTPRYLSKHYKARRAILETDFEVIDWQLVAAAANDDSARG